MNRRSVKNTLVRPRQQLRLGILFIAATTLTLTAYIVFLLVSLVGQVDKISRDYNIPHDLATALNQTVWNSLLSVIVVGLLVLIVALFVGVKISHRIFGPLVPIQRLVRELASGNYQARGTLRPSDEFQDIMKDLNTLAAKLDERHGGSI